MTFSRHYHSTSAPTWLHLSTRSDCEIDHLLLVAQAVEDTDVRAYKGQAGRLLMNGSDQADVALESAFGIHSVETPAGASAQCRDGSYSWSKNGRGTCSHHGGVAAWM